MGNLGSALADPTPTPSAVMLEIEIAAAKKRITKRRQAKYKPRNSYVSPREAGSGHPRDHISWDVVGLRLSVLESQSADESADGDRLYV